MSGWAMGAHLEVRQTCSLWLPPQLKLEGADCRGGRSEGELSPTTPVLLFFFLLLILLLLLSFRV